jgi:hypothetical protein
LRRALFIEREIIRSDLSLSSSADPESDETAMPFLDWLYSLFFGPPPEVKGYGFAWDPEVAYNNVQFVTVTDQSPRGLYVMVTPDSINRPREFFDDPATSVGLLYPLAVNASAAFNQAMQGVTNAAGASVPSNNNLMVRLEGFLKYTDKCLNYIYSTQPGRDLLTNLRNADWATRVTPSDLFNQTHGNSMCFVADMVNNQRINITAEQRAQLIQILERTANEQGANVQGLTPYQWLASEINQMPLYSLFEELNAYPPAFLDHSGATVNAGHLEEWFTTGPDCHLVRTLQAAAVVQNVELFSFVKNAVVILLYANSPPDRGVISIVNFDVRDWSDNTRGPLFPQTTNTMADRPPVIALAHELIHAYHNGRGDQPGRTFQHFSTTLFELLCVGAGPWAAARFTENAIRAAWPPPEDVWPAAGDPLNLRAYPQRTVYEAPARDQPPELLRLRDPADLDSGIRGPI